MPSVLETMNPVFAAMAEADVRRPDMPIAIYHQETHDLLAWLEGEGRWGWLRSVGLTVMPAEVEAALAASREAQAGWAAVQSPRKAETQLALEERAVTVRLAMVQACRWNLRGSRPAMGALDRIVEGQGVADTVQDLDELAELVQQNVGAFAVDETFAAMARADEARQLAQEVRVGLSGYRTDDRMRAAVGLRDRAWTHLDNLVTEVRAAGQYAYRGTADVARFASAHERRRRAAQRRNATPNTTTTQAEPA